MKQYIAYYRVSTKTQGNSGLGLDAQRSAVRSFVKGDILQEFTEVESGKNDKRLELSAAIEAAKVAGAVLVIAKLDRLSRNAGFIFQLKESGVEFVCADMPEANTLTIGIFAVLAQHERELISERTKKALAELKAKGVQLGSPQNLTASARAKGVEAAKAAARNNKANKQAGELVVMYAEKGLTLQTIADKLNEAGYTTRRGKSFNTTTVLRLAKRYAA